jgi:hypothetical protein
MSIEQIPKNQEKLVEWGHQVLHHPIDVENKFEAEVAGATLVGKIDLYNRAEKVLTDFKTAKVYSVKMMKQGKWEDNSYMWQLNIYKAFGFPKAEKLQLECLVKDWSPTSLIKDKVAPIEVIEVPLIVIGNVKSITENMIRTHLRVEEDPTTMRDCLDEELWYPMSPRNPNYGIPLRCKDYCEVSAVCPQWKKWKEKNGYEED